MTALIDLLIQSANQAFENSGVSTRLVLAHTARVETAHLDRGLLLPRLKNPDDGYMDEVHSLRNVHAADLVHLLGGDGGGGTAGRVRGESLSLEREGFAVSARANELIFAHEIGHNFELTYDRYVVGQQIASATYPYSFGYVNTRAFEAGAATAAQWRTVMSYPHRCTSAGFFCLWLLRFSNPDQTYEGDPLGVSSDSTAIGPDGPADARLTMNNMARWVGSFRSEACTDFSVSSQAQFAPAGGGEIIFQVETDHGCLWRASSQWDFLSLSSDARYEGSGVLSVGVKGNSSGEERTGNLTVAGKSFTVRQTASDADLKAMLRNAYALRAAAAEAAQ